VACSGAAQGNHRGRDLPREGEQSRRGGVRISPDADIVPGPHGYSSSTAKNGKVLCGNRVGYYGNVATGEKLNLSDTVSGAIAAFPPIGGQ
jgi:hypothetical protein